jgi:hypothetical protein
VTRPVDVDDTRRCPLSRRCASCGRSGPSAGLAVWTAGTPVGVLCLTLCPGCARAGRVPTLSWSGAIHAVWAHCVHLGVDLDEAAEARQARDGREGWR